MPTDSEETRQARLGAAAGLGAFLTWGILPLYYKWFGDLPALEILSHRVAWSALLTVVAVAALGRMREVEGVVTSRRRLSVFVASAAMISVNWLLYIWSVTHDRLLEASMGYFIYPLISVLLGAAVLRERLAGRQLAAVGLVAAGVAYMVVAGGVVPWIALTLAVTFGLYGLLRKTAPADSLVGLTVETCLVAPLAFAYLVGIEGGAFVTGGWEWAVMLALAGPATALPLLLFAYAARRVRLSTLGLMQYVNPSSQMLVAVLLFGEAFTTIHAITFGCVWLGLAVYSLDPRAVLRRRAGKA